MSEPPTKRRRLTNQKCSDKKEEKEDDSLEECRLRHGLNDDCLCLIFDYLSIYDLIQVCELDSYFEQLIAKWVIHKKLINFTKMDPCWSTNKIFQVFGKTMRKIKIAEENTLNSFDRFLNFVIKYCAPNTLSEIELRFGDPTASASTFRNSMVYFTNLKKLVLHDSYSHVSYKEFMIYIGRTATNLKVLTFDGVSVFGAWLRDRTLLNLEELRLYTTKRFSVNNNMDDIREFFETKQKLKIFSFIGTDDISAVAKTLIDFCPNLKTYNDIFLRNPYGRDTTQITDSMKNRYAFVREFLTVRHLTLTSFTQCGSDIYYPLIKLAAKNRLESLNVYIDRDTACVINEAERVRLMRESFGHFSSLTSVGLQIRSEASDQCDLESEFICHIMSELINLRKISVMSEHSIRDIYKVLEKAPQTRVFNVAQVKMKYLPLEMRKIVRIIRTIRQQNLNLHEEQPPKIHLIVNERQYREVQVN